MTAIEREMLKAAKDDIMTASVILSKAQENGRRLKAAQFDELVRVVYNARQWLHSATKESN